MDQTYWLDRKRASAAMARGATSSEARLVHFELAGRYSVKAANCSKPLPVGGEAPAMPAMSGPTVVDDGYYAMLEEGARYLASEADDPDERHLHLGMANHYARLAMDADSSGAV